MKFNKKTILRPQTLILIFLVLTIIMFSSALIELKQSKLELLELMQEQAHSLLETVITSSNNALLTYEHLEQFLAERLLNNAGFIRFLYEKGEISNDLLSRFAEENNIYRLNIFSSSGEKILWSHQPEHTMAAEKTPLSETLKPIFSGKTDTLIIGIKQANYEGGMSFAVALAAKNRSAIVLNLDAEELLNFRRQVGFGSLLKNISHNPGIVYLALQDSLGIIAASGKITELERIEESQFLSQALADSAFDYRIIDFDTAKVYEAIQPFFFADIRIGLFRLGLSLEPLKKIEARIYRRIGILSASLLVFGFVVFTFILIRQNYNLLERQFHVVESYSSDIIRHVSDSIIVLDENKKIKIFNQAAERLFEIDEKNVIGRTLSAAFGVDEFEKIISVSTSMNQIDCQINNRTKNLLVSTRVFKDEKGDDNFILVIGDLTDQRKLEAQIQRKERLAAMGELASGVAHEIRNPLNAIGTIVQQLEKDFEPSESSSEYHQLTKVVINEVFRINETIQAFLRFARPEPIRPSSFQLSALFAYLQQQYKPMFDEKHVKFIKKINWDGAVFWDRQQMQQVMMNLVENAVDAMPTGGELQVELFLKNEAEVEILIKDNGNGIPEKIKSKIFNLYFTTKAKGTGIGLSIVQRIVYEHGGIISIESQEQAGTTVIIKMPIKVAY